MERPLTRSLRALLGQTDSLGVGLADANGLLLQSEGQHAGQCAAEVAAHLSHGSVPGLSPDGQVNTNTPLASSAYYVRRLAGQRYFLYIMLSDQVVAGSTRRAARRIAAALETLLTAPTLGPAAGERLEQPREFTGRPLIR